MSNDRDRELDELESALKGVPHIEKPDALNIGDGTACWINQDRMCERRAVRTTSRCSPLRVPTSAAC